MADIFEEYDAPWPNVRASIAALAWEHGRREGASIAARLRHVRGRVARARNEFQLLGGLLASPHERDGAQRFVRALEAGSFDVLLERGVDFGSMRLVGIHAHGAQPAPLMLQRSTFWSVLPGRAELLAQLFRADVLWPRDESVGVLRERLRTPAGVLSAGAPITALQAAVHALNGALREAPRLWREPMGAMFEALLRDASTPGVAAADGVVRDWMSLTGELIPAEATPAMKRLGELEAVSSLEAALPCLLSAAPALDPVMLSIANRQIVSDPARGDALVVAMLRSGVSPALRARSGDTVLHLAARHGSVSVATAALAAGADPDALDRTGRTAAQIAHSAGQARALAVIGRAGASPTWVRAADARARVNELLAQRGATGPAPRA